MPARAQSAPDGRADCARCRLLTEAAVQWEPEEVFWIVQNGVTMSGMPAFGPDHGDEAVLEITAFAKKLPA